MTAAVVGAWMAGSIAIPLIWDRRHPTPRSNRSHPSTRVHNEATMRQREKVAR